MILSVDIGFGYTKAATNGREVSFPSVVGAAEKIRYESDLISQNGKGIILEADDGNKFVGELALLQSRLQWTLLDRSRTESKEVKWLFHAAMSELVGPDEAVVQLVTGLPVEHYGDRAKLQGQLIGTHLVKRLNQRPRHFQVTDCLVVPQPFGSLFTLVLDERGEVVNKSLALGRLGLIDIGTFTTDFVLVDRLRYIEKGSGSLSVAMSKAYEMIQRDIADVHGLDLEMHEVDKALRVGAVMVFGNPQDVTELARPHLTNLADEVMAKARSLWGDGRKLDAVLVSGGGAYAIGEMIVAHYPHAQVLEDSAMANVRGYLRYGLRKFGK